MTIAALIVAAGRGTRAASSLPKQYARVGGVPVLARTLRVFLDHPRIDVILVVIGAGDGPLYLSAVAGLECERLLGPVEGGATRQASVRNGLKALAAHAPDSVLIHDAVRPFVTSATIDGVIEALEHAAGALAASPPRSTGPGSGARRPRKASATPISSRPTPEPRLPAIRT